MTESVVKETVGCGCEVRIESVRTIVPQDLAGKHGTMHLLRHPDGAIYMNAHALGLYRTADNGELESASAGVSGGGTQSPGPGRLRHQP